ncbi:hypothetical protein GW17_00049044 [Ensete ventricosum]|nr:hypothetical protein GW17_00049044 [Ensete ventricosum]
MSITSTYNHVISKVSYADGFCASGKCWTYNECIISMYSFILSFSHSSVFMGGRYFTVIGAGLTLKLSFLQARCVPASTIGTIGNRPELENSKVSLHNIISHRFVENGLCRSERNLFQ